MTSSRPYLIRAIHEWIVDNDCTPYILVNAAHEGVDVPTQHVENDKIILNMSPKAVNGLMITNELIEFNARFAGVDTYVCVPQSAVMAIYARENGQGMIFDKDDEGDEPPPSPDKNKPKLRIVK